jgi:hypothetical protein
MLTVEHVPGKPCGRQGFAGGTWPEDVVPKQTGRTARGGAAREAERTEAGKIEVKNEKGGYKAARLVTCSILAGYRV